MKKQSLKLFTISLIAFVIIISVLLYFFSERFTRSWIPLDHGFGETVTLSSDDQSIVFPFYQSGDGALYKAKIDGSEVMQLTYPRMEESHIHPRFSSDGEKLLFLSQEKTREQLRQSLYIMNKDGSNLVRLSEEDELVTDAIFSEDGQTIFYFIAKDYQEGTGIGKGPNGVDLYSITISGKDKQQLTQSNSADKRSLSRTEDGKYVGFVEITETDQEVRSTFVLYNLEEKDSQEILPEFDFGGNSIYSARISPEGNLIAFSAATENPRKKSQSIYELYTMDVEGEKVEPITSFRTFITEPVFFHQENRVLFIQDQRWKQGQPNYKLWAVDIDGESIQSITLQMPQFSGTAL